MKRLLHAYSAICRSHGAVLATRNTDDYSDTGVTIASPWIDP